MWELAYLGSWSFQKALTQSVLYTGYLVRRNSLQQCWKFSTVLVWRTPMQKPATEILLFISGQSNPWWWSITLNSCAYILWHNSVERSCSILLMGTIPWTFFTVDPDGPQSSLLPCPYLMKWLNSKETRQNWRDVREVTGSSMRGHQLCEVQEAVSIGFLVMIQTPVFNCVCCVEYCLNCTYIGLRAPETSTLLQTSFSETHNIYKIFTYHLNQITLWSMHK